MYSFRYSNLHTQKTETECSFIHTSSNTHRCVFQQPEAHSYSNTCCCNTLVVLLADWLLETYKTHTHVHTHHPWAQTAAAERKHHKHSKLGQIIICAILKNESIKLCSKKKKKSVTDNSVSAQYLLVSHSSVSPQCLCQLLFSGQTTVNVILQCSDQSDTSYKNAKTGFHRSHLFGLLWYKVKRSSLLYFEFLCWVCLGLKTN